MTEEELRALVRETVERHLGRGAIRPKTPVVRPSRPHASHLVLPVEAGEAIGEGLCLIEPTVRCNHCGYCQSYGH